MWTAIRTFVLYKKNIKRDGEKLTFRSCYVVGTDFSSFFFFLPEDNLEPETLIASGIKRGENSLLDRGVVVQSYKYELGTDTVVDALLHSQIYMNVLKSIELIDANVRVLIVLTCALKQYQTRGTPSYWHFTKMYSSPRADPKTDMFVLCSLSVLSLAPSVHVGRLFWITVNGF